MANTLLSFTLLLSVCINLVAPQSTHLAAQSGMGCATTPLFGSVIDQNTQCVLSYPLQRSLDSSTSSSYGINSAESCFQQVCADCNGCAGIEYNPSTGVCSARFTDEVTASFVRTGTTLLVKGMDFHTRLQFLTTLGDSCQSDQECGTNHCDLNSHMCFEGLSYFLITISHSN